MRIEEFDLSVDRTGKPEQSTLSQSGNFQAIILRCDSPATIFVDSVSGEGIPALPGATLTDFKSLYIANNPGGGVLTIVYYECAAAPPAMRFPYAREIVNEQELNDTDIQVTLTVPGPDWYVLISSIDYSQTEQTGTFAQDLAISDKNVGAGFSLVWNGFRSRGLMLYQKDFSMPLVTRRGRDVLFQASGSGAGGTETHRLVVTGAILR